MPARVGAEGAEQVGERDLAEDGKDVLAGGQLDRMVLGGGLDRA